MLVEMVHLLHQVQIQNNNNLNVWICSCLKSSCFDARIISPPGCTNTNVHPQKSLFVVLFTKAQSSGTQIESNSHMTGEKFVNYDNEQTSHGQDKITYNSQQLVIFKPDRFFQRRTKSMLIHISNHDNYKTQPRYGSAVDLRQPQWSVDLPSKT